MATNQTHLPVPKVIPISVCRFVFSSEHLPDQRFELLDVATQAFNIWAVSTLFPRSGRVEFKDSPSQGNGIQQSSEIHVPQRRDIRPGVAAPSSAALSGMGLQRHADRMVEDQVDEWRKACLAGSNRFHRQDRECSREGCCTRQRLPRYRIPSWTRCRPCADELPSLSGVAGIVRSEWDWSAPAQFVKQTRSIVIVKRRECQAAGTAAAVPVVATAKARRRVPARRARPAVRRDRLVWSSYLQLHAQQPFARV